MKNLTGFRKTVETGMDPRLLLEQLQFQLSIVRIKHVFVI